MSISFVVYGVPQSQGSIRAFMPKGAKHPVLTSDNATLKPWRQDVAGVAMDAMRREQIIERPEAVRLKAAFFFQKPKSRPKRGLHTVKPDLSKLVRSIEDSMSGIVYEDDSQITEINVSKSYDQVARVEITVEAIA